MTEQPNIADAQKQHRRETRRQIYWPFGLMIFVFILVMVLVFTVVLPRRVQVSLVADYFTILCFLCPLLLCLFPIYLLAVTALYGVTRLHDSAQSPLTRIERLSQQLNRQATDATDALNQRTIEMSMRFAFLSRLFDIFDRSQATNTTGEDAHEPKSTDAS